MPPHVHVDESDDDDDSDGDEKDEKKKFMERRFETLMHQYNVKDASDIDRLFSNRFQGTRDDDDDDSRSVSGVSTTSTFRSENA